MRFFDTQRREWLDVADLPRKSSIGAESTFDRLSDAFLRQSKDVAEIVGLFEGDRCRRCDAAFPGEERQREHRAWHTWGDHNRRADYTEADELSYFGIVKLYLVNPDVPGGALVDPLPPPTPDGLKRHAEKFEPKARSAEHALPHLQKMHRDAVDEMARLHGLAGDDLLRLVHEARQAGKPVSEIAEDYGVPDRTVKQILGRAA